MTIDARKIEDLKNPEVTPGKELHYFHFRIFRYRTVDHNHLNQNRGDIPSAYF